MSRSKLSNVGSTMSPTKLEVCMAIVFSTSTTKLLKVSVTEPPVRERKVSDMLVAKSL